MKQLSEASSIDAFKKKFVEHPSLIGDIFVIYPSIRIPIHRFLEIVPSMKHRLYSIASSPKLIGAQSLELIVTDVEWDAYNHETGEKKKQRGLTTGFLYELSGLVNDYTCNYFDRNGLFPC